MQNLSILFYMIIDDIFEFSIIYFLLFVRTFYSNSFHSFSSSLLTRILTKYQIRLRCLLKSRHCAALEPHICLEEHKSVDREASIPETGQRNGGRSRSVGGKIYQLRFPQVDFLAVFSLASHLKY
ncbi:hypothetical protein ACOSQ3_003959 [Xanthoceras sorbifolium]